MLSCKEVTRRLASDALEGGGWWRRLSVRLHLLMCRHCRRYAFQMRSIGTAARRVFRETPLEETSLERLRASIREEIREGPPPPGGDASPGGEG